MEGFHNLYLKTRSTPMSETPISPLRARMLEDMRVRNFGEPTLKDYTATLSVSQYSLDRSSRSAQTRAMPKSSFQVMVDGPLSLRGSKAQLRLPLAWIPPMHQTHFGRWRSLLLRAWAP